jgi:Ca2+-binding EF-hand superfamily protein
MTVLGGDEGARYSQEMWRTFLEEVDTDGDGKITLEEFKFMMKEVNSLTALTS